MYIEMSKLHTFLCIISNYRYIFLLYFTVSIYIIYSNPCFSATENWRVQRKMKLCLVEIGSSVPRWVSNASGNSIFLFLSRAIYRSSMHSPFWNFICILGDRLLVKARLTNSNEIVVITFAFRRAKNPSNSDRSATHIFHHFQKL